MGRPYLIRFAITKLESRIGTARITSGKARAINAFVFRAPWTATTPSRYPSRFDPESPRKIEAGWEAWRREPSDAPAAIIASTPAPPRARDSAMGAEGPAPRGDTPAARPAPPAVEVTTVIQ